MNSNRNQSPGARRIGSLILISLALVGVGTANGQTPPEPDMRGNQHFSTGMIQTGSGWSSISAQINRTVVDISVPGSVGRYPLSIQRTMRNWVTDSTSDPRAPAWSEAAGCDAHWVFNIQGYTVRIVNTGYVGHQGVFLGYPDGSVAKYGPYGGAGVYLFGSGDRVYIGANNKVTLLKLADGGQAHFTDFNDPNQKIWPTSSVTDPNGLIYTYTGTGPANAFVRRITDASGRWVSITMDSSASWPISADSSAGDHVDYAWDMTVPAGIPQQLSALDPRKITEAHYADGTIARYEYAGSVHGVFPFRCFDVRATTAMRSVEYSFNENWNDWGQVYQHLTPNLYPLVSERLPNTVSPLSSRAEFPAYLVGGVSWGFGVRETRGDGAMRTVLPNSAFNINDGRIHSETDFSGNQTTYVYGLNASITDPLGRITRLDYVSSPESRAMPAGSVAYIETPTKITFPDGTFKQFIYTDLTNPYFVAQSVDELGRSTTYARLANGLISQINYPDGSTEAWTYNSLNRPITHRLRNGNTESFAYDGTGLLIKHLLPTTPDAIDYTYYPAGHVWQDRLKTITDGRGNVTTYEYDLTFVNDVQGTTPCSGRGLVTKIINPDGTYKSFGYDIYGNKVWEENEFRQRTSSVYDAYNRPTSVTDPLGRTTQFQYQHTGFSEDPLAHTANKPRAIISPAGRRKGMFYDADFKLITEVGGEQSGDASSTAYEYDAAGNMSKVTDPVGRVTTYAYDNRNRRITEFAPLNRTTDLNYDVAGNLVWTHFPDGTIISKEYDSMNRLTRSTDEMMRSTNYVYYPSGKVQWIIDPKNNAYGYWYDASDRPTVFWLTNPDQTGFDYEQTGYDAAGNVTSFRNRSGAFKSLNYDTRNREISTSWNDGITLGTTTTYDAAGRVTRKANASSALTYSYDAAGQPIRELQAVAGTAARAVEYEYDGDGNRTRVKAH